MRSPETQVTTQAALIFQHTVCVYCTQFPCAPEGVVFMCDSERIRQVCGDGTGHGGGDEGRMELHVRGGQHGLPLPVAEQFAESSVYIKILFLCVVS